MLAKERRDVEQSAAWERMEAKTNKEDGTEGDKYVTKGYLKQLEIQKENALITEVEEQINSKKTANAETGMSGFYNILNKQGRLAEDLPVQPEKIQKQDQRGRLEEKLRVLKEKRAEKE